MTYTEAALSAAIERDEFRLVYQPLLAAGTRRVTGVEALVRWQHPHRGLLGPGEFLPAMERNKLMTGLTNWTIERALATTTAWRRTGVTVPVSVNLSATMLGDTTIVDTVNRAVLANDVSPGMLTLEVTETALADQQTAAAAIFTELRRSGVRVSVDDFGTGYTSLAMLKDYTFDEIKIDRSFVAGLRHVPADAAIVRSVLELGHRLGLDVVAEGIEDAATARLLEELGCDILQGFHFARPMPADDAIKAIRYLGRDASVGGSARRAGDAGADGPDAPPRATPPPVPLLQMWPAKPSADDRSTDDRSARLPTLDTAAQQVLDGLVFAAAQTCGAQTSVLTIILGDREWIAGRCGPVPAPVDAAGVFDAEPLPSPDVVTEIPDAWLDDRFAHHPLVDGDPALRFYAAAPMVSWVGQVVGALCVVDPEPKTLTADQREALRRLAVSAIGYLEARRSEHLLLRLHEALDVLSALHSDTDIPAAGTAVAAAAKDVLRADGAILFLRDEATSVLFRPLGVAVCDVEEAARLSQLVIDSRGDSASAHVIRSRAPLFVEAADTSARISAELVDQFRVASAIFLPVVDETSAMGVLSVWWHAAQAAVPSAGLNTVGMLADVAGNTLSRLYALSAVRNAADADPLTGLLNRRSFQVGLKGRPAGTPIVIVDLDDFTRVNDERGHFAGDQVLTSFAAHLRAATRDVDLVARWGDEEFAIALTDGDVDAAGAMLARLTQSWRGGATTFSAGYTVTRTGEAAVVALQRADRALSAAKHAGGDQHRFTSGSEIVAPPPPLDRSDDVDAVTAPAVDPASREVSAAAESLDVAVPTPG